jgi:hypothetical protein
MLWLLFSVALAPKKTASLAPNDGLLQCGEAIPGRELEAKKVEGIDGNMEDILSYGGNRLFKSEQKRYCLARLAQESKSRATSS